MKYFVTIRYSTFSSEQNSLRLKLTEEQTRLIRLLEEEGCLDDYTVDIASDINSWEEI